MDLPSFSKLNYIEDKALESFCLFFCLHVFVICCTVIKILKASRANKEICIQAVEKLFYRA